jgi:hypothetical protein
MGSNPIPGAIIFLAAKLALRDDELQLLYNGVDKVKNYLRV